MRREGGLDHHIHMCISPDQIGNSWLTDLISTWAPFRISAEMISQRPCFAAQCNAVCWVCACLCQEEFVVGRREFVVGRRYSIQINAHHNVP